MRLEAPLAPPKSNVGRPAANVAWSFGCCAVNPVDAVSREVGETIAEHEQWREQALAGMEAGLKTRTSDPLEARLNEAVRRVGELTMTIEIRARHLRLPDPRTAVDG